MPGSASINKWFIFLPPLLFVVCSSLESPGEMPHHAWITLLATAWIAFWWVTEAIPIPATSLLPIVLFPMAIDIPVTKITAAYGHPTVFLFMGGFIIALGIEKCNLHKRISLNIIKIIGTNQRTIILGFMASTWLISMWISNTAASLMMLPIALAVIQQIKSDNPLGNKSVFALPLLLGIAYAASIGGISTPIGSPTNVMLSAISRQMLDIEITFASWISMALPLSFTILVISWFLLCYVIFKTELSTSNARAEIDAELQKLGSLRNDEKKVIFIFSLTALAWICRSFLLQRYIPGIDDTIIAISGALLMFIVPSSEQKGGLIGWETTKKLPWGVLLLFGGGLTLTVAFEDSGLAIYTGKLFEGMGEYHILVYLVSIVGSVNFLTEVTSNVATTSIVLPLLVSFSNAIGVKPLILMYGATLSASCAFMLPVATPPNAVVFGSGLIRIIDMVKAGFLLNIISIVLITLFIWLYMPLL
ncbi:MAG: DASS family sodium-coupled anion symporter [Cyclobacteriaceae bacterium]|nr:DASS family sodium-coupled anion symporter [Cyclobacteriaceae bacterium]